MKKEVVISLALLLGSATGAYALPFSQPDGNPGRYVNLEEESIFAYSDDFLLYTAVTPQTDRTYETGPGENISGLHGELALNFDLYGYAGAAYKGVKYDLLNREPIDVNSLISVFSQDVPSRFPVPEPATMMMLGAGLSGLAFIGRKSRKGPIR